MWYQFYYIWIAKAVVFIIGVAVMFIGIKVLSNPEMRDKYEIEVSLSKFCLKLKAGSLGILVMFLGAFLIISPFVFTIEYSETETLTGTLRNGENNQNIPPANNTKMRIPDADEILRKELPISEEYPKTKNAKKEGGKQ